MLDLRDDGTIGIDFGDGQSVVLCRPKFGAYKRIRAQSHDRIRKLNAFLEEMQKRDAPVDQSEINQQYEERSVELTAEWWQMVLVGDESFKSLVISGNAPPIDDLPPNLIYAGNRNVIDEMMVHWRSTPLGHGSQTEPAETPTAE